MTARPMRMCIACRLKEEKGGLLRFVLNDNQLTWDRKQKLPGRGAYLHAKASCVEKLRQQKLWQKAFRGVRVERGDSLLQEIGKAFGPVIR